MKSKFRGTSILPSKLSENENPIKSSITKDVNLVKSKFDTTSVINTDSGNLNNNFVDRILQFQIDNDVGSYLEVKVDGNLVTVELKSKTGNILGSGSFNTGGGTSINRVTLDNANERLDFELANGNHFYCSLAELYASKQDLLLSGVNIKTIDGLSILGPGNIDIGTSIRDIQVNGLSIVQNKVANLALGSGITYDNNTGLTLSVDNLEPIKPKELSTDSQKELSIILIDDNGDVKKTSLNDLDYTKLKVVDNEDLSIVNNDDFLFVKER